MTDPVRILCVDDVAFSRLMVERALTAEGYEVLTAGNAQEALATLESEDIDLVVTDLSMPQMDGIRLLEESRKIKKLTDQGYVPPPPFIMLTAIHDRDMLMRAQQAGFEQILLKPFDVDRMKQAIEHILRSGKR